MIIFISLKCKNFYIDIACLLSSLWINSICIDNVEFFYTVIYLQTIIYVSWFTLIITTLKVILKTCLLNSLFVVGLCSHWTEFDKISNVDQLGQMENSLRESLNQIRTRKVYTIIPSLVLLFQRYFYEFSLSSWS